MRLVLPTGPDGADRDYPLDNIADLSQITLNEVIDMKRMTGLDLDAMRKGLGMLDKIIGIPNDAVLLAMSEHLELMEAWRALVWLARYRAGDRDPDGNLMSVTAAVDFPFAGINIEPDPGDLGTDGEDGEDQSVDPPVPPVAGERATGGASPARARNGRSRKTSATK